MRPAQYIEITEPAKRYAADIPAPLSQIDEPTEDVFKEEKEAALKKQKGKKNEKKGKKKVALRGKKGICSTRLIDNNTC